MFRTIIATFIWLRATFWCTIMIALSVTYVHSLPDQRSSLELGRLKGGWGYFFFRFTISLIVGCYNYAIS